MHLKCIQHSQEEPISLEEAKLFLRVDHHDEDTLIQTLISAAREYAETVQRNVLGISTWEWVTSFGSSKMHIPLRPLQEIISIAYQDRQGSIYTLSPSQYEVQQEGNVVIVSSEQKNLKEAVNVMIQFMAGIPIHEIPFKTKQAILLLIGTWYEHREAIVIGKQVTQVPFTVQALLSIDRRW